MPMKMSPRSYKALKKKKANAYSLNKKTLKVPKQYKNDFHPKEIEALKSQFEQYDVTGDGSIDADELGEIFTSLGENVSTEQLEDLINEVDVNNSRAIEFDEFIQLMHNMRHGKSSKLGLAMIEAGYGARINKELGELQRDPIRLMKVSNSPDGGDSPQWKIELSGPNETAYAGGLWHIQVRFGETYPFEPPTIVLDNRIHHINMPTLVDGSSSLAQLLTHWTPSWRVRQVLENIVRVLRRPDLKMAEAEEKRLELASHVSGNPLPRCAQHNSAVLKMYKNDRSRFDYYAREYTRRFARPPAPDDGDDKSSVTSVHHHHKDVAFGLLRAPNREVATTRQLEPGHLYFFPIECKAAGFLMSFALYVTALGGVSGRAGVNIRMALFQEARLQRPRVERKMDKSLKFHLVRVPNSMPTSANIGPLQSEVEVDVFDQDISVENLKTYYAGVVVQDEVELECCTRNTASPYKHYNFEYHEVEERWRSIDMGGRTHPLPHEDCIQWCIAMKVAIPTHHEHGAHSGNAGILARYRQQQEELRSNMQKHQGGATATNGIVVDRW